MSAIPQTNFPDYSNLVGIPYSQKDCFEIVRDFYKQVFGMDLKRYYEEPGKDPFAARDLIYSSMGDFVQIDPKDKKFGDIVLLKIQNIECHIGIYIGGNQLFHSSKISGSVIDRLSRWKPAISGYYRVRGSND